MDKFGPKSWKAIAIEVAADQLLKLLAQRYLSFYEPVRVISGKLHFQLVHNTGAAYSILRDQNGLLLAISILVIAICLIYRKEIVTSRFSYWGLIFLMTGIFGNFIDRLVRGHVVDFIDIRIFPVFNLADVCIDIGVPFFILEFIAYQLSARRR